MGGIRDGVRRLFRIALRRDDLARNDVEREIDFHLTARVQQLVAGGMTLEEARAEARRRFGDVAQARAELSESAARREAQLTVRDRLEAFTDDVRYVARTLRRSPGLSAVVVLTLALGIGANAAMFGIIDRLLVRGPEYVVAPDRVFRMYATWVNPAQGPLTHSALGYVSYGLLRDQSRLVERAAVYT
ncbi:MAG: permease prefix domain 1-containing protein, partial [Gemmatimonadaceae bacterium]